MKSKALYFTGKRQVEVREEKAADPSGKQIGLASLASLVSAGSELLVYRGELSKELEMEKVLPSLEGKFSYPLKFGYSIVGKERDDGGEQRYFAFNPHESHFASKPKKQFRVPEDCPTEDAIFLANMETAINIVLDANPRMGESVALIGLGVLGLLTGALLKEHPLGKLVAFDEYKNRRKAGNALELHHTFDPNAMQDMQDAKELLGNRGADIVIELTGNPEALNLALDLVGPQGKVWVASWYGKRRAQINLGSHFHQGRIQILSSQVGQIAPELRGRWGRKRRFELAWHYLKAIKPSRLITHRFSLERASEAYELIDQDPENCLAIVLEY